jgi:hypothetical protein
MSPIAYTHEEARILYEQALEAGEILSYSEIIQKIVVHFSNFGSIIQT